MFHRFSAEHVTDLRLDARIDAVPLPAVEDEGVASRSAARLLITSPTREGCQRLARRVHLAGARAKSPFVQAAACDFSIDAETLAKQCGRLLDAAAGGSLLITDVEEMPTVVQHVLIDIVATLEQSRSPSAAVRYIAGTTASLLDRVTAGTFSGRLFYRLNVIHLTVGNDPRTAALVVHLRRGATE